MGNRPGARGVVVFGSEGTSMSSSGADSFRNDGLTDEDHNIFRRWSIGKQARMHREDRRDAYVMARARACKAWVDADPWENGGIYASPCSRLVHKVGAEFCWQHDPALIAARKAAR
jgi:hypothetical protein